MSDLTLSVVMPNYNHAAFLPQAIEGIVNQSRPPDEFLILDDASTDNSLAIIESYAARYPAIRVLRNEINRGVVQANQRLFSEATGDYLHAAAADDQRCADFYMRAMQMAKSHPESGLIFGKMVVVDEHDKELSEIAVRRWQEPLYADPQRFLREYLDIEAPSHSAVAATIFRRLPFLEVGGYREELGSWADSFAVRAIGLKCGACYMPERFAIWRRLSYSFSAKSRSDARHTLDLVARAAHLMRSKEFRDRFPAAHVRRWKSIYRLLVIRDDWRNETRHLRESLIRRGVNIVPRMFRALSLAFYRGDLSCFTSEN